MRKRLITTVATMAAVVTMVTPAFAAGPVLGYSTDNIITDYASVAEVSPSVTNDFDVAKGVGFALDQQTLDNMGGKDPQQGVNTQYSVYNAVGDGTISVPGMIPGQFNEVNAVGDQQTDVYCRINSRDIMVFVPKTIVMQEMGSAEYKVKVLGNIDPAKDLTVTPKVGQNYMINQGDNELKYKFTVYQDGTHFNGKDVKLLAHDVGGKLDYSQLDMTASHRGSVSFEDNSKDPNNQLFSTVRAGNYKGSFTFHIDLVDKSADTSVSDTSAS